MRRAVNEEVVKKLIDMTAECIKDHETTDFMKEFSKNTLETIDYENYDAFEIYTGLNIMIGVYLSESYYSDDENSKEIYEAFLTALDNKLDSYMEI